jgi:hypothetical protein
MTNRCVRCGEWFHNVHACATSLQVTGTAITRLASAPQKWKCGNEFAPYHPSASYVDPNYRDGWNACYAAAMADRDRLSAEVEQLRDALITAHKHLEMHKMWISHCKDAAKIDAALRGSDVGEGA